MEANKIICGDSLEVMEEIPDKSIDMVLTDPLIIYRDQIILPQWGQLADREWILENGIKTFLYSHI